MTIMGGYQSSSEAAKFRRCRSWRGGRVAEGGGLLTPVTHGGAGCYRSPLCLLALCDRHGPAWHVQHYGQHKKRRDSTKIWSCYYCREIGIYLPPVHSARVEVSKAS